MATHEHPKPQDPSPEAEENATAADPAADAGSESPEEGEAAMDAAEGAAHK